MKYQSVNQIEDFEFHDAELSFVSLENNCLTVSAKHLNIHKGAVQNQSAKDMEIDVATIRLEGFQLGEFEPWRSWKRDEKGTLYTDEPRTVITEKPADELFLANLKHGITVFDLGCLENMRYYLDGMTESTFFTVRFLFDKCLVCWDSYKKASWYEEKRNLQ